jgi:hypothetical protein
MSTHTPVDPTVEEADRRVERAKASLLSRVEQLKHRFADAGHKLDLHAQIAQHPLSAVGIAFAVGALVGWRRRESAVGSGHSLSSAVIAGLATVSLRVVREIAMGQLSQIARHWWVEQEGAPMPAPGTRRPNTEPFLEH